jgi:uroporphyrinogen III methyltransferase / synthase
VSNRAESTPTSPGPGRIVFVGAGPGDPGLLTQRAVQALAEAELVLLERADLVPEHLVVHAEVVVVPGADATKALLAAARRGVPVVRVLPGDPWVDSTAAAEAAACAQAGIPFDVVPGVPVPTAVAAYAGVPLVRGEVVPVEVAVGDSAVLRGSLDDVAASAKQMLADGADPQRPVVLVTGGTTSAQRSRRISLEELAHDHTGGDRAVAILAAEPTAAPLEWFESRPLFGWRVLVPRTKDQAGPLVEQLRRHGAVAEEVPTISVEPPRNPNQIERALRGLVEGRYAWIVFTSVNALRAVRDRLEAYGLDARAMSGIKVAAVGDKTAAALEAWGIRPELVPSGEQSSRGLLADWPAYDEDTDPLNRVFLPRADIATDTLAAGLAELGWEPEDVTAYRTVRAAPPPAAIRDAIKSGAFDAVVFTSSSTVRNLVGIAGKPHASTVVACIGPQTAKTVEEHAMRVDVLAGTPSVEVLADSLAAFAVRRRDELVAAGEPVVRPSQRRRSPARRAAAQRRAT